jgi:hypothetical protein
MMRSVIVVLAGLTACTSGKHSPITQGELIRNTQQLFDSVAAGDVHGRNISRTTAFTLMKRGEAWTKRLSSMT